MSTQSTSDKAGATSDKAGATPAQPLVEDKPTPGDQDRVLTPEEDLDHAVEETFPASDPISPSRIDTPST